MGGSGVHVGYTDGSGVHVGYTDGSGVHVGCTDFSHSVKSENDPYSSRLHISGAYASEGTPSFINTLMSSRTSSLLQTEDEDSHRGSEHGPISCWKTFKSVGGEVGVPQSDNVSIVQFSSMGMVPSGMEH